MAGVMVGRWYVGARVWGEGRWGRWVCGGRCEVGVKCV